MASEVENKAVHPAPISKPHHQIRRKPVPSNNNNNMPRPRPPPTPQNSPTRAVINDTVHLSSEHRIRIQPTLGKSAANPPDRGTPVYSIYDPRFNNYLLNSYASTFEELTTLKSTLDTLRADYVALENDLRQRMDEYVCAREEAKQWKERCIALQRREGGIDTTTRSLRAQNDRFARTASGEEKLGEVWRRKDSFVWVREDEKKKRGGQVGMKRVSQALAGCEKKLRRRWGGWKLKRQEEQSAKRGSAGEDGRFLAMFSKSPMRPNA